MFENTIEDIVMRCLRKYFAEQQQASQPQPQEQELKPELTISDVIQRFSISRPTVYKWIEKGILKPYRIGGRIYFSADEVSSLMENQRYKRATEGR